MYLQQIKKLSLSIFDDKRCYINETESKPWNNPICYFINRCKKKRKN